MYCSSCGIEVAENHRYCPQCGTSTGKAEFISQTGRPAKALSRPREDRKIAGVCSGIARYIGIDVTLVRILFLVFAVWPPTAGLIVYLVCWIVMPQDPLLLPPPRNAQAQNATVTP
ncbi:MAG TPA: PspC domain-containing protein [Bryobacteraceae bacterium]|jgi:phage shock protein C